MISYAQFYEDVYLARCFPDPGVVYVDVGAHHPVRDNVTFHFYLNGGRGLCLDGLA